MRAAPPVGLIVSNAGAWRGLHVVLAVLAGAVLAAWALALATAEPLPLLVTCAASGAGALAAGAAMARWQHPQPTELRWDGVAWRAAGEPVDVAVMIDLGRWMLLRCRAAGAGRWLAVPEAEAGAAWPALRAALYAGPPAPPPGP